MNCFGKIVIVTVDASKVKADLVASADPVDPVAQQAVVATSGWTRTDALDYLIKDAGNVIFPGKDWLYRAAITVDDGTLGFATPALKGDKYYDLPFQTEAPYAPDDDEAVKAAAHESLMNSATTEITASDMAWVCGWLVRNGKSMGVHDLINNDHSGYVSDNGVLGMGWSTNFYNVHNLVGITYDGKIAFMINEAGFSNWDGQPGYVDVDNGWKKRPMPASTIVATVSSRWLDGSEARLRNAAALATPSVRLRLPSFACRQRQVRYRRRYSDQYFLRSNSKDKVI